MSFIFFIFRKVPHGSYSGHHWRGGRHSVHHSSSTIRRSQQQEVSMQGKRMTRPMHSRSRSHWVLSETRKHLSLAIHYKTHRCRLYMSECGINVDTRIIAVLVQFQHQPLLKSWLILMGCFRSGLASWTNSSFCRHNSWLWHCFYILDLLC